MFKLSQINKDWTLFLDRDGVINYEIPGTYVTNANEFIFYPNAPENISVFNSLFQHVFIATNQRGITRGLMTLNDLDMIHDKMTLEIEARGGKIDRIYFCTDFEPASPCRKPNIGMALEAKKDFPTVELSKSIMVGNNLSDMMFGRNAGMKTVFLRTTNPELEIPHGAIDLHFNTLDDFTKSLQKIKK